MTRYILAAIGALALAITLRLPAAAAVEFCSASFEEFHQIGDASSTLYAYTLNAREGRVVSGQIVAKSGDNWFTFPFASAALTQRVVTGTTRIGRFTRDEFSSQALYVRFPVPVNNLTAYVSHANASSCTPLAGFGLPDDPKRRLAVTLDPRSDLTKPPTSEAVVATATVIAPPGDLNCPEPFMNATVARAVGPSGYSSGDASMNIDSAFAKVTVMIDAGGNLADAYIWLSSGHRALDLAAIRAARASTYDAGWAFCVPVPGIYIFNVEFSGP